MASFMKGSHVEWTEKLRLHADSEIEACLKESPQFLWLQEKDSPLLKKVMTISGKVILFDPQATETMTLPAIKAIRAGEK